MLWRWRNRRSRAESRSEGATAIATSFRSNTRLLAACASTCGASAKLSNRPAVIEARLSAFSCFSAAAAVNPPPARRTNRARRPCNHTARRCRPRGSRAHEGNHPRVARRHPSGPAGPLSAPRPCPTSAPPSRRGSRPGPRSLSRLGGRSSPRRGWHPTHGLFRRGSLCPTASACASRARPSGRLRPLGRTRAPPAIRAGSSALIAHLHPLERLPLGPPGADYRGDGTTVSVMRDGAGRPWCTALSAATPTDSS